MGACSSSSIIHLLPPVVSVTTAADVVTKLPRLLSNCMHLNSGVVAKNVVDQSAFRQQLAPPRFTVYPSLIIISSTLSPHSNRWLKALRMNSIEDSLLIKPVVPSLRLIQLMHRQNIYNSIAVIIQIANPSLFHHHRRSEENKRTKQII
mmetsp:Transcript_32301/g.54543  ORF Transcript_32301/g.54543 Transcript_32301/m.54543 type:complete len:149 (-) Transcript_32301:241-687(-)